MMSSKNETDEKKNIPFDITAELARVDLSRPVYTYQTRQQQASSITIRSVKRKCTALAADCCTMETLWSFLPVFTWLRQYQWKSHLVADILAGFTVGIMSIPQGMAYARLAGMPPVYGLYSNIVPTFVYFFLGTARIAAIGPATVLSLITSSIRYKHIPCEDCWIQVMNATNVNSTTTGVDRLTPIDIGSGLAFLVGIYLIILGLFRLSFISNYLPDQLVGGFTIAAAVQVFAGQLSPMFGIRLPNRDGIGKVVMNFIDLFRLIAHTNVAAFITFLICFVFLFFCKHVLTPRLQSKMKIPFPGEFIVMVVATLASHFGHLDVKYDVSTVRHIAAGFPAPQLPKLSLLHSLAVDALLLAVMTYSYSISLAKLYAKRSGHTVRPVQEFYAYGFMNLIGSFFQCFNSGQTVARSLVYEAAGAKSQLCGLFGTFVVILTVLFIAPLLESLPDAALAAIIVAACTEMFRTLRELPAMYRKSKYDAAIYVVTMTSVILLDVTYGLAVSVSFSLLTVIIRSDRSGTEPFNEEARLLLASDVSESIVKSVWDDIVFLRVITPWFYANAEKVKNALLEGSTLVGPDDIPTSGITKNASADVQLTVCNFLPRKPAVVILDLSSITFTDLMGINAMKEVSMKIKSKGIDLYVCGCTETVSKLTSSIDPVPMLFPSVLDAFNYARHCLDQKDAETEFIQNGTKPVDE